MQLYILSHALARQHAERAVREAPDGYAVEIKESKRTIEQNCFQWPYLEGFSQQMKWPVNGEMVTMDPEEWKDVLTSAFEEEVRPRLAMGFDGKGVVMLGRRTRDYGKKKFALWMDWLQAAAALKGVEPVFKSGHKKWECAA